MYECYLGPLALYKTWNGCDLRCQMQFNCISICLYLGCVCIHYSGCPKATGESLILLILWYKDSCIHTVYTVGHKAEISIFFHPHTVDLHKTYMI